MPLKNSHSKILIEPNFISASLCDFIVKEIKKRDYEDLQVFDAISTNMSGETSWKTEKVIRDTQTVNFEHINPLLFEILKEAVLNIANPFFNVKILSSEVPQVLRYGVGGHYSPHIDSEGIYVEDGIASYKETVDRDISFIFYLNDEFKGGEIIFPNQNITITPKKGMMLAFPSDHNFVHGVNPVTEGERFGFVTWASLKN